MLFRTIYNYFSWSKFFVSPYLYLMRQYFYQAKQWITESLFPDKCAVCFGKGVSLHKECITPFLSFQIDNEKQLIWLSRYNEPVIKKLIKNCKFFGFTSVVDPWIMCVSKDVFPDNFQEKNWVIVPVPLHWSRRLWRGFNQSFVIANGLKNIFPNMAVSSDLLRTKKTKQQAKLSRIERKKNIEGAFVWSKDAQIPQKIIIVDDVYTSGATLREAKKTLLAAGAKEVWCLVLARKFSV